MKKLFIKTLFTCLFASSLEARIVTLWVNTGTDINTPVSEVTIGTNEFVTVVAFELFGNSLLRFVNGRPVGGFTLAYSGNDSLKTASPITFAGPLTISLTAGNPLKNEAIGRGYCSLKIESNVDQFPPDKTLVIPGDTKAVVIMESSPDLSHWTSATPGAYTNVTGNLFFRIRAERP